MTCWGKWNAMWHFIFTLFCWCLSAVETLIEQLHEAWDVQSCLLVLKLVVQRKELSRLLGLRSAHFYVTAQSLTWEPELIVPLKSMLMLGLYQHVSEPSQKRLSKAFIQWSVIIGMFSVLGALSKCSRGGPLGGCCDRFWGRDGYRLHFIDTDTILINTVIHTTLYNLVQK